jgi:hypothetical protein
MINNYRVLENNLISLCPTCLKKINAKKVVRGDKVYLSKSCDAHGFFECLLEDDYEYYSKRYEFDKPGTESKTQTEVKDGCPFDCGLCTEHKQHTCIGLIEVTTACDISCPTCYANSGKKKFLELSQIEKMVDFIIDAEGGFAEIIQISGGEPTTHPDIIKIIKVIKSKNVKYVMLNTNGVRIAKDDKFVEELAQFKGGFEIYLQFDGLDKDVYEKMRGRDLLQEKLDAIKKLSENNIPITMVTTVERGVNDNQLGRIFEFGVNTPLVRGINFQPVAYFGRCENKNGEERVTLTGILKQLEKQTNDIIRVSDFVPLPCNVERVAISYLYREKDGFTPITRKIDIKKYLPAIKNTFNFNANEILNDAMNNSSIFGCSCFDFLKDIRPLIPKKFLSKKAEDKIKFINKNVFRVSVTSFVDAHNFDVKSAQKECVHIITPDFKRVPFSMFNLIYRDKYENN